LTYEPLQEGLLRQF